MNKTIYIIAHVDRSLEDILEDFLSPEDLNTTIYHSLEDAEKELEKYLEQGLEYTIHPLSIVIS